MKKKRLNFPSPWRAIFLKIDACLTFFVEKKKKFSHISLPKIDWKSSIFFNGRHFFKEISLFN